MTPESGVIVGVADMKTFRSFAFVLGIIAAAPTSALARPLSGPVEPGVLIDFEDSQLGTPANGLRIGAVTFSYNLNAGRSNTSYGILPSAAIGDDFPTTPNTSGKGIQGSPFGALGLHFDRPVSNIAFGFALHAANGQFFGDGSVRNAVIVNLFDPKGGFIGSFSDDGMGFIPDDKDDDDEKESDDRFSPDRGGGAEYNTGRVALSTNLSIGSASISFATEGLPPFDLFQRSGGVPIDLFFFDNLSFDPITIPLPTPLLLTSAGLLALASIRRRRAL